MRVELETGPGTLNIITVDGVAISLQLLRQLANTDPQKLYRMERNENVTVLTIVGEVGELRAPPKKPPDIAEKRGGWQ